MKKEKILAVILDGGICQGFVTNDKKYENLEIMVIDYDTEGAAEEDTLAIDQNYLETDGSPAVSSAYVSIEKVGNSAIDLNKVKKDLEVHCALL